MPLTPEVSAAIDHAVDACAGDLLALSRRIHAHPELRFEEHKASGWIADFLVERGHAVERGLAGMPTAVRSSSAPRSSASGSRRPCAAILAEYDALPGVGHACGHNLIAAAAAGAFVAAATVADGVGGEVVLLGTPAEEGGGGKIEMIKAGIFDAIDAAMMSCIRSTATSWMHPTLASLWIVFEFRGTPSHRRRGAACRGQRL